MIKCIALLPIIQWLWQQGSILSVAWEKQDDTLSQRNLNVRSKLRNKEQRMHASDFYFLLIEIALKLLNTFKRKARVTNICFYIMLKGWELLKEAEKCLHHLRSERCLLCGIRRSLRWFNFIKWRNFKKFLRILFQAFKHFSLHNQYHIVISLNTNVNCIHIYFF